MDIVVLDKSRMEELIKVDKSCFLDLHWDTERWNLIFNDLEHNKIYAVLKDNKIVGYLMIYNWGKEKNYVKLTNIGVLKEVRNNNYASKLIEFMLSDMRKLNMHDFRGETRVTNYPMQKTFEKFGFKKTEVMKDYYDNPTEDAYKYILVD